MSDIAAKVAELIDKEERKKFEELYNKIRVLSKEDRDKFVDGFIKDREPLLINLTQEQKEELLLHATYDNALVEVRWLLNNGINVDIKDKGGWTPLMLAIKMRNQFVGEYLIEKGADLFLKDSAGRTPLMLAVGEKNLKMVKFIIGVLNPSSVVINQSDYNGATLLIFLVCAGCSGKNGASFSETEEELEILDLLLKLGVKVNATDRNGFTALTWAAVSNKLKTAQRLRQNGAEINLLKCNASMPSYKNKHKITPLMAAAMNGHLEMCKFLIENGAKAKEKNSEGKMAIMLAGDLGHRAVAEYLQEPSGLKVAYYDFKEYHSIEEKEKMVKLVLSEEKRPEEIPELKDKLTRKP